MQKKPFQIAQIPVSQQKRNLCILLLIWVGGVICDRVWFGLDHNVPGWDQADYLTGALNYGRAFQSPEWLNRDWWRDLWLLSSKIPPLTYIVTGLWQNLVGAGIDQATMVMSLYSGVLLGAVYGLGLLLFDASIGLWAAGLCQIIPGLYRLRLEFLLDYPLAAMVTLSFFCLTLWHFYTNKFYPEYFNQQSNFAERIRGNFSYKSFGLSLVLISCFGITLGLSFLTKQTALFFLLIPLIWAGGGAFFQRRWLKFFQLIFGLWVSTWVFMPWYRTNWLTVLTSGKRATIDSAIAEGDAPLNTLAAWTFYWQQLPYQLSWPLLLLPLVGVIIYGWKRGFLKNKNLPNSNPNNFIESEIKPQKYALPWLIIFLVTAYLLSSLNVNKDDRYIIPYLPTFTILLAYGLTRLKTTWWRNLRLFTIILAIYLTLINLFPLPIPTLANILSPRNRHYPYQNQPFPHTNVIQEIIRSQPYLRSTVGVLPSTYSLNQHNFNYYGAIASTENPPIPGFQVYARQVANNRKHVNQDIQALDWFITKTGNLGSINDTQKQAIITVEKSPNFQLQKTWKLPDGETLNLYHTNQPKTIVKPIDKPINKPNSPTLQLTQITLPPASPPGQPIPITYTWEGNLQTLRDGIILLTWQNRVNPSQQWIHDQQIGMGNLYLSPQSGQNSMQVQVSDRTAMFPPANLTSGTYQLKATYIHRKTRKAEPINIPDTTIEINPQAQNNPAPDLDLPSQFRLLAATMPQGLNAFERIFAEIGRINQYDPTQDYLKQVQIASAYRLQQNPQNLDLAYTVALTKVLQRDIEGAIASLEHVTKIDANNPFAWGYLAFVHLYNWHPQAAENALEPALKLNPQIRELKIMAAVSKLLQGKIIAAYRDFSQ